MPKETQRARALKSKTKLKSNPKVVVEATIANLMQTESETRQKWSQADNTKINYRGYVGRAVQFLEEMVAARQKRQAETGVCEDDTDTSLLSQAFSNPPNKYSVTALLNFLMQKCFVEQHGKSTAQGIQAAMAKMWDKMDGQKYAGDHYHLDESTGSVTGNPARAPSVKEYVKCINTKSSAKGAAAIRHHADAMLVEDLIKIVKYSKAECSCEQLEKTQVSAQELIQMIKHGLTRAFLTSGFTLWTRNFELCGLQARDIDWGLQGAAPYHVPYFRVHLDGRKGWQNKQGWDGPLESNYYNIYAQPDSPDIDMYTYLPQWVKLLEQCLGRALEPDDYIFPYCSSNGIIHSKREMTHDMIQNLLNEFGQGAGLKRAYTTHSLRRGGAQYRFMFAPIGRHWSLSVIRWWGGWAIGEHVDTLMKYLVDSLQSYESGHSDALHPLPKEAERSFMGDHVLEKPVTTAEFRVFAEAVLTRPAPAKMECTCPMPVHAASPSSFVNLGVVLPTPASQNFTYATSHSLTGMSPTPREPRSSRPQAPPIPGVVIPDIGKGPGIWRKAVKQWEVGEPLQGLQPLRDWPKEWYTGSQRTKTGSKYNQRKLIALEYQRYEQLGAVDAVFIAEYPEANESVGKLLSAIRKQSGKKGQKSKNGTPEERRSSESNNDNGPNSTEISG
ncbi:hypothetical protein IW261DRAFT_1557697 [Armillaria novae-zelandiae]|uniref:Tyr recombinase domain-containing protein n=1 Tax=Armillaria novae-zelandiae TaxID=153914 RepID=A0AA39PS75_9AGAR|nr:hypothetical protein IW261DRAFT_1557697 [Armillaria novae-zelandiae]